MDLTGTGGQSFGVWNAGGLNMTLRGDANDYVGKGLSGGRLIIYPPRSAVFKSENKELAPAFTALFKALLEPFAEPE